MKIHRFIGDFDFAQNLVVSKDPELYSQIKQVLRLELGEQVILSAGDMTEAQAKLVFLGDGRVEFEIIKRQNNSAEPHRRVILYLAILKRENFELAAQKVVECGIAKIVPIISERTIKTGLKKDRLEKIIKEASEQAGRGIVPVLAEPMAFSEALEQSRVNTQNLFFDQSGEVLSGVNLEGTVGIFIGPEGGWTERELESAKSAGCQIVGLGKLTMRGETATIVASYLVVHG